MTTITLPLVENGKVLGVFGIDIALGKLSELIAKVTPYGTGYANLFSNTGTIVASGDLSPARAWTPCPRRIPPPSAKPLPRASRITAR